FERLVAGIEKRNRLINPRERRVVAVHEMGHALVASLLPNCDPVHKISIIPRGVGALGYTLQRPAEDRLILTERELRDRMAVLFGGRAAEMVVFGHLSTGAADDLVKATELARGMVMRYGMNEELGSVTYESSTPGFLDNGMQGLLQDRPKFGNETADLIDHAVKNLIDSELRRSVRLISTHRRVLEKGAAL